LRCRSIPQEQLVAIANDIWATRFREELSAPRSSSHRRLLLLRTIDFSLQLSE
jgi:hypothetical protein